MMARDFASNHDAWDAMVNEATRLADALPDGGARLSAFAAEAEAAGSQAGYVETVEGLDGGAIVQCVVPGPKMLAFVDQLRSAVSAGRGVA